MLPVPKNCIFYVSSINIDMTVAVNQAYHT
jgi:hypothetical protein